MHWPDERYVRLYTRDTPDWQCLSFPAQGLFCLILRKVDRAGVIDLGKLGKKAVGLVVGFPGDWARIEPALDELLADGCVRIEDGRLVLPNFIEAQECEASDKARARASRERRRDGVTKNRAPPVPVTPASQNVTSESRSVTPPSRDSAPAVAPVTERDATVTPNQPSQTNRSKPQQKRGGFQTEDELVGGENPGCSALRLRLAEEGHDLAWPSPERRATIEAAVVRCGVEPCVAACLADAKGMKVPPKSLGIFAPTLTALRPHEPEARPKPVPIVNLAWLEQLPEPTRSEARAAWEERRNEVESTFAPETHPHWLAAGAEVLRARFAP